MRRLECKLCGGTLTRIGNCYVCDYCNNKWMIDMADDIHAVERANAWMSLREGDFERAAERFESIIVRDSKNHEAYWGRSLALNGIVYVNDAHEVKRVPTCNNITENSFLKDSDVQKAISFAPSDIKKGYAEQAEQIEKIRVEWLNKARKEPPYDVFISFKDSDKERGIERTQDSIDAQEIYTGLVEEGYKVFFSRVSLRGKVSEQYEPYIYNAIKTAKVMIVFGEKPEYFNATWIKNEWSRFRTRIDKGEKHKNSLIVVVKNMDPSDLPVALKSRQAMNMSDLTFFETLKKHIKRVIDEEQKLQRLERIEIVGGQKTKKQAKVRTEQLSTRELGSKFVQQISVDDKAKIELAHTYVSMRQPLDAIPLLEDVLFNNPNNAQAKWLNLIVKRTAPSYTTVDKVPFLKEDCREIEQVLTYAEKKFANDVLEVLYSSGNWLNEDVYADILKVILPFNCEYREELVDKAFSITIQRLFFKALDVLFNLTSDTDKYIQYNLQIAKRLGMAGREPERKRKYLLNVLEIDASNKEALNMLLEFELAEANTANFIKTFEEILKYSTNINEDIKSFLGFFCRPRLLVREHSSIVTQVIKYYQGELKELSGDLVQDAERILSNGYYGEAVQLYNIIISEGTTAGKAFWGICLAKAKVKEERELGKSDILIKKMPEYTKYLTMVSEMRRIKCIEMANEQECNKKSREEDKKFEVEKVQRQQANRARVDAAIKTTRARKRTENRRWGVIILGVLAAVSAIILIVMIPNFQRGFCKLELQEDEYGQEYYAVTGVDPWGLFVSIPDEYNGKPVTRIEAHAFKEESLVTLTIGENIEYIDSVAFYQCNGIFGKVRYKGTISQWQNIRGGGTNLWKDHQYISEYVKDRVYCSDGWVKTFDWN